MQTQSGAFNDLNFNELQSPLLSTILEHLKINFNDLQGSADDIDYVEVKSLFDEVLESIRVKVGDREVSSLLWNIILRARTIKTENGAYSIMLKL